MISESPVVTVHIPLLLRPYAGGYEEVTASGDTVGEVLEALCREHPAIRQQLMMPDGRVNAGIAVYLGSNLVSELQGLATPVALEELISLMLTSELTDWSVLAQRQVWQAGPLDGIKQVFDQQTKLGVTGNLQFPIEEKRVGVLLASEQLEIGGEMGGKGQVGLASGTEYRSEHAVSIGE